MDAKTERRRGLPGAPRKKSPGEKRLGGGAANIQPTPSRLAGRPSTTAAQRAEFARRLLSLADTRGWNQSDLARAAFGSVTDNKGYEVARRRDSISSYLRGDVFPDHRSLAALCNALGVAAHELAPFLEQPPIGTEETVLEIRQIGHDATKVWLHLKQIVSLAEALAISRIIFQALKQDADTHPASSALTDEDALKFIEANAPHHGTATPHRPRDRR